MVCRWEPNSNYVTFSSNGDYVPSELGICVDSCPMAGESRTDPYGEYGSWESLTDVSAINFPVIALNKNAIDYFFCFVFCVL